jgi:hypothetical protein
MESFFFDFVPLIDYLIDRLNFRSEPKNSVRFGLKIPERFRIESKLKNRAGTEPNFWFGFGSLLKPNQTDPFRALADIPLLQKKLK